MINPLVLSSLTGRGISSQKTAISRCTALGPGVYCTHSQYASNYPEPTMRPIDELAAEICTLAGHINAANHRLSGADRGI